MCNLRVDLAAAAAAGGRTPEVFTAALDRLDPLHRHGLVAIDGWVVTVPEPGRPLLRQVCAAIDAYLCQRATGVTQTRHAEACHIGRSVHPPRTTPAETVFDHATHLLLAGD